MKRVSLSLRDDCHKALKLFIARRDMTIQDFYINAGREYLSKYSTEEERQTWPGFEGERCRLEEEQDAG